MRSRVINKIIRNGKILKNPRLVQKNMFVARKLSTSVRACSSHYDVLGVTPKSTQSDIKSAYYKLSKIYHPDKNSDEASAKKFRAITEAYNVLGNIKLKKMYDRGLMPDYDPKTRMTPEAEAEPTDPTLRFYKSRNTRHAVPTMTGKTPIYDFDAWAKNHYSSLYEKKRYDKEFVKQRRAKRVEADIAHRQETLMVVMLIISGVFVMLAIKGTTEYDKDLIEHPKTNGQTKVVTD